MWSLKSKKKNSLHGAPADQKKRPDNNCPVTSLHMQVTNFTTL